jgi:heme/copper-type cytochrome/quinol oxidase subunit 3
MHRCAPIKGESVMKNWFLSQNGAITLSLIAFLTFLGRTFLDWRYENHLLGAEGSLEEFLYILMFLAFAGGWVWGMLAAKCGSRGGLIACLIFALLLGVGFAAVTYFSLCPPATCKQFIPNLWQWNWAQLISGLVASISIGLQLTGKKGES